MNKIKKSHIVVVIRILSSFLALKKMKGPWENNHRRTLDIYREGNSSSWIGRENGQKVMISYFLWKVNSIQGRSIHAKLYLMR